MEWSRGPRRVGRDHRVAEVAVPPEDKKREAHQALVDGVLKGEGRTSREQRARAFHNTNIPAPLHTLISKVATEPTQITDADIATATASGLSEDELFELVIC